MRPSAAIRFRPSAGSDLTLPSSSLWLKCPSQDSVFEFEKKRNVPIKYDRDLWQNTVKAMKRIKQIRVKRESQFIHNRCVLLVTVACSRSKSRALCAASRPAALVHPFLVAPLLMPLSPSPPQLQNQSRACQGPGTRCQGDCKRIRPAQGACLYVLGFLSLNLLVPCVVQGGRLICVP